MSFSCTHHCEPWTTCTSKALATEPHTTATAHGVHATQLCRAHLLSQLSTHNAGTAWLEPPRSFQPPHPVMETLSRRVPQLPSAQPRDQSRGAARQGRAPGSPSPRGWPAIGESIQEAGPLAPKPRFACPPARPSQPYLAPSPCPGQRPPAAAPPRPARGAASSSPLRRGRLPPCETGRAGVSGGGQAAPSHACPGQAAIRRRVWCGSSPSCRGAAARCPRDMRGGEAEHGQSRGRVRPLPAHSLEGSGQGSTGGGAPVGCREPNSSSQGAGSGDRARGDEGGGGAARRSRGGCGVPG